MAVKELPSVSSLDSFRDDPVHEPAPAPLAQGLSVAQSTGAVAPATLVGRLVALADGRTVPLVTFEGQAGEAAVPARSTIDLLPSQIGRDVLLIFPGLNMARPVVIGVLRSPDHLPELKACHQVEVQADGRRLTITAQAELVLRCGRSRIILSADGRLELSADIIVSHAAGVNRVHGGSVQLN